MEIFKSLKGVFGQPKVDPKRLVITTHTELEEPDDDDIIIDSVTVSSTQGMKTETSDDTDSFNNKSDEDTNNSAVKVNFFNDNRAADQQLLVDSVPDLDDENALQQLIEAVALEIINNTDRKLNLAEQVSLRLKSHLGIVAAPVTKQDEANLKLVNFFKLLKTKLNHIGV